MKQKLHWHRFAEPGKPATQILARDRRTAGIIYLILYGPKNELTDSTQEEDKFDMPGQGPGAQN